MIQKIRNDEYLKRADNMSLVEREDYVRRVGEWVEKQLPLLRSRITDDASRFQGIIQCSVSWNDAESKAWMDGVRLLTALVAVTDTWLPELLFVKSAKRSIKHLITILKTLPQPLSVSEGSGRIQSKKKPMQDGAEAPSDSPGGGGRCEGTQDVTQAVAAKPLPSGKSAVPVRPKHIDQYVHLLPKATQVKAVEVRTLLRDLDAARENARRLMDANEHPDKIAQWAKVATRLDERLKGIYKELDAEWEKLVKEGRIIVDEFGNASPSPALPRREGSADASTEAPSDSPGGGGRRGRPAMTEEEKAAKAAEQKEKKIAENLRKAALLRKFLIDKRNAKTETHKEKWVAKYKEMVKLGGEECITDKVREAAEYYGIELSPSPALPRREGENVK